jgi:hypothetical protein
MAQFQVRAEMVALPRWKSSEYRAIAARVPVTPNFLCMNNLDGAVQFVGRLRLFHPVALLKGFVCPPHEVGSDRLRNAATNAAGLFDIEITQS